MKRLLLIVCLFFCPVFCCFGQSNALSATIKAEQTHKYYLGTNPFAFLAAFQLQDNIKRYIPELSGLEYGFSLNGGYFLSQNQALEGRFSMGNTHQFARVTQIHLGSNYFLFKKQKRWFSDLYVGGFCKLWDYHNRLTGIHFYNLAPYLTLGHIFKVDRVLLDIRLNQAIAVVSWSSLAHTSAAMDWFFSPWPAFLPVMPSLTFSVGWKL